MVEFCEALGARDDDCRGDRFLDKGEVDTWGSDAADGKAGVGVECGEGLAEDVAVAKGVGGEHEIGRCEALAEGYG